MSIVLPTRNGARYLGEAVRSVVAQTFRDWELIVVDDASTDDTPGIAAALSAGDGRIRVVRSDRRLRLPGALNAGFAVARGEYHGWTSDDNLYRPEAIAEMAAFLDAHPGADVVYADYTRIDPEGRVTGSTRVGAPEDVYFGNCIGPCFLYRRTVGERLGGYREDLFLAEDMDFWLRASAVFTMRALRKDLYVYRTHGDSLTSRRAPAVIRATERALRSFYAAHPVPAPDVRAKSWLALASRALQAGRGRLADKYFVRAAVCSPAYTFRNAGSVLAPRRELEEAGRRLAAKEREVEAIRETLSWRVTAPLRALGRLVPRRKGGRE